VSRSCAEVGELCSVFRGRLHERIATGEPLKEAVLDAGIMRLRPVLITVLALVIALDPLALRGGPLWEPMCYANPCRA
jgi:multidrug efflux pump subunit AcrB